MTLTKIDEKQGQISTRDPATLMPHPVSAMLYLDGDSGNVNGHILTALEAAHEIREKMDVADILESIRQEGILSPIVVNEKGIIISGSRRWDVAMQLGLTSVPVEVKSFRDETEEELAIVDYNRTRNKTESQKMKETDLYKEIMSKLANKRMLAGKRNPTPILGEGLDAKRHARETNTIVASVSGKGKETFRKVDQIWQRAKAGDQKAAVLMHKLDAKKISINAAYNTLTKSVTDADTPATSKWQRAEPIGQGNIWICPECGQLFKIFHLKNGGHRLMDAENEENNCHGSESFDGVNNNDESRGD